EGMDACRRRSAAAPAGAHEYGARAVTITQRGDSMITQQELSGYLGKSIGEICGNNYADANDNHCAHFVSHVMGYQFGATCRMMAGGQQAAANIRVQEIFPQCGSVGAWASRPEALAPCLVFITNASNVDVAKKTMANV